MMSGARALRTAQSRDAGICPECLRGKVIMACPTGRRPQGRPERHWRNYSSRLPLTCRLYGWENQRRGLGRGRPGGFAWIAACDPCPGILQKMDNDCCVSSGFVFCFLNERVQTHSPFPQKPTSLPAWWISSITAPDTRGTVGSVIQAVRGDRSSDNDLLMTDIAVVFHHHSIL